MHYEAERTNDISTPVTPHTPVPSHQAPRVLLRFSPKVREELEQWEFADAPNAHTTTAASKHASLASQPSRPRRRRRPLRALMGLLLFLTGVSVAMSGGLLELRYRQLRAHDQHTHHIAKSVTAFKRALQTTPQPTVRMHPALTTFDKHYQAFHKAHTALCLQQTTKTPNVAASAKDAVHTASLKQLMRRWQRWLWQQAGPTYRQQRQKLWPDKQATPKAAQNLCAHPAQRTLLQVRDALHTYHKARLSEAEAHIRSFQWCQLRWSPFQEQPAHKEWLAKLRQQKCKRACQNTKKDAIPRAQCSTCLRKWRTELNISTVAFQRYRTLVEKEQRHRCFRWQQRPAHNGVFHLGAFYWRVSQALAHASWLERHKLCGSRCQQLRKRWGTRLKLTSQPAKARIYMRLWSPQAQAPTKALATLAQIFVGTTGTQWHWLPALSRKETRRSRNRWALLQVYHPNTKRQTYIPLLTKAGAKMSRKAHLQRQQLHNDGRQPVRHPSITPDGRMLAFLTYNVMPWEPPPTFQQPQCWPTPTQQHLSWRTAMSLYQLNIKGQPKDAGQHLYTRQWLREIQLVRGGNQPLLMVTSPYHPAIMSPLQPPLGQQPRAGAWLLDLRMSLRLAGQRARQMTPMPQVSHVDLPIGHDGQSALLLRQACEQRALSGNGLQLLQVPPKTPPQLTPPPAHVVVHAAQNRRWFALLLHPKQKKTGALLALYSRRSTSHSPTRTVRLRLRHRQIVATRDGFLLAGGRWGTPLQSWTRRGVRSLTRTHPHIRYLDPALHPQSQRLFVVQQKRLWGTQNTHAAFLLSWTQRRR